MPCAGFCASGLRARRRRPACSLASNARSASRTRGPGHRGAALAASLLLAVALGSGSTLFVLRQGANDRTTEAALDAHVRGLMAARPTDIESGERHTVKPWFNGLLTRKSMAPTCSTATGSRLDWFARAQLGCAPQIIQRKRSKCFGDARRRRLAGKLQASFGELLIVFRSTAYILHQGSMSDLRFRQV